MSMTSSYSNKPSNFSNSFPKFKSFLLILSNKKVNYNQLLNHLTIFCSQKSTFLYCLIVKISLKKLHMLAKEKNLYMSICDLMMSRIW
jgi:hypothetical protein